MLGRGLGPTPHFGPNLASMPEGCWRGRRAGLPECLPALRRMRLARVPRVSEGMATPPGTLGTPATSRAPRCQDAFSCPGAHARPAPARPRRGVQVRGKNLRGWTEPPAAINLSKVRIWPLPGERLDPRPRRGHARHTARRELEHHPQQPQRPLPGGSLRIELAGKASRAPLLARPRPRGRPTCSVFHT